MRKYLLAFISACVLAMPADSDAQFLKKLGNAVKKAGEVAEALSGNSSSNSSSRGKGYGRMVGKPVMLGGMKLAAYGENPGCGFNFVSCVREDNGVVLSFSLPNQSQNLLGSVCIQNFGNAVNDGRVLAYGTDGTQYDVAYLRLGSRHSNEAVLADIPPEGIVSGAVLFRGVPRNVNTIGKVVFGVTAYVNGSDRREFTFVLDNVPVATPVAVNSKGIGPVAQGMTFDRIPESVGGLYDKVMITDDAIEDMGETLKVKKALFFLNGKEMFEATGDPVEGIWTMNLISPDMKINVEGNKVGLGDRLDSLRGVKGVSIPSETGYAADYDGVYFDTDTSGKIITVSWGTMM